MVPPVPADVETVYVYSGQLIETVHAAVIAPVVYVVPEREPLQPEVDDIYLPVPGVIANEVVEP